MKTYRALTLGVCLLSLAAVGCKQSSAPKVESESKTTTTTPQGSQEVKTSTEKVGETQVTEQEVKTKTDAGTVKTEADTVVGTVSEYVAGDKIVVMTADNDKHSYDLNDKDVTATVAANVTVGTKVKLEQHKDDAGHLTISVSVVS